jgi:uncharacterized phage protein (TIGR01671 family)
MKTFRVWDIEAKTYRRDCFLASGGELWFNDAGRLGSLEQSKFVIQFWTGLLDKSEVEIYEGDILNLRNWGYHSNEILGTSAIEWSEVIAAWSTREWLSFLEDREDFGKCLRRSEVIGNVYENPELL